MDNDLIKGIFFLLLAAFFARLLFPSLWSKKLKQEKGNQRITRTSQTKGFKAKVSPSNGFVVFDLETTGLSPGRNKIIELAAIKVLNMANKEHATIEYLIRIKGKVPTKITELTTITDDLLATEGVELSLAINELKEFCGSLPLVAYNAKFDKGFLLKAAQEQGWKISNEFHCALLMAREAFPGHDSYKLSSIAAHAGIETSGSHRALSDCSMAVQVYVAAFQKMKKAIAV
jgi:DNA polymerase III epsilon subunit family exonuclease